jgi:hypothetical protein
MKTSAAMLASLILVSTAIEAAPLRDRAMAHIGETVRVHGMPVTPLQVLEDSRCPKMVTCVWAGRVRLAVRIDGVPRELAVGQAVDVRGGQLRLAAVAPDRTTVGHRIPPRAYRFGFEFTRGSGLELIRR